MYENLPIANIADDDAHVRIARAYMVVAISRGLLMSGMVEVCICGDGRNIKKADNAIL